MNSQITGPAPIGSKALFSCMLFEFDGTYWWDSEDKPWFSPVMKPTELELAIEEQLRRKYNRAAFQEYLCQVDDMVWLMFRRLDAYMHIADAVAARREGLHPEPKEFRA